MVVGAPQESSSATGVNGNQSDNSMPYAGAAYVLTGFGPGPRLVLAPDGTGGLFVRYNAVSNVTYQLQRAASVTGTWTNLATNTAPASGLIEYHETSPPPGQAFYRTVQP